MIRQELLSSTDRYRMIKTLGEGGMGQVYLAEDTRVGRKVAVKMMEPVNLSFGIEMELLRELKSDLFPIIYDAWIEEQRGIIIMEYVEGKNLKEFLQRQNDIGEAQIYEWGKQIARFLQQLHNLRPKILYRDLKPENIMVLPNGRLKMIDFGAAAMLEREKMEDGKRVGTYGYASPEQWSGQSIDVRSDIFSMGAVLLDLFRGTCEGVLGSDIHMIGQNRYVPKGMEKIILKCVEEDPERRYASVEAFLSDWETYQRVEKNSMMQMLIYHGFILTSLFSAAYFFWCCPSQCLWGQISIGIYVALKALKWIQNFRRYRWIQTKSVWCRG